MGYLQSWAAANPDSARVLLAAVVFAVMYATRKLLPGVWTFFETRSPWLGDEMKFLDQLLHKLWQAVPSALTGALLGPALFGDGWKQALIGALNGLAAPLSHELMARYRGQLRSPKTPGGPDVQSGDSKEARDQTDVATPPDAVMLQRRRRFALPVLLAHAVLLASCSSGPPPKAPCDKATLAVITARCSAYAYTCAQQGGTKEECTSACHEELEKRKAACQ